MTTEAKSRDMVRCQIHVYRLTDNLFNTARCKIPYRMAAEWVEQDRARWCKNGKAIQQTEAMGDQSGTRSALSRADRAITSADSMANAGAEESDNRIAAARSKVQAWPLVGAGNVTRAPLPAEPGGIRRVTRAELKSFGAFSLFDCSVIPVDYAARMNGRSTTRLLDNDFVQQCCEDDLARADELDASESFCRELGEHEVDETVEKIELEM